MEAKGERRETPYLEHMDSPRMPSCCCRSTPQASPTGLALIHACMAASCTYMHKFYGTNTKMSTAHSQAADPHKSYIACVRSRPQQSRGFP